MSSLSIIAPPVTPAPPAAPGKLVDTPSASRPADVPRTSVIVQLSEQVRQLTDTEKRDTDERKERLAGEDLSDEQKRAVEELKRTDREVRSHEAAHKAAAGAYARGAAQFETVVGPDGRRYAVGGEVAIDASAISGNPGATAQKMRQVARAALAPADPSAQDHAVAAQAREAAAEARREIIAERSDRQKAENEEATESNATSRSDTPADAGETAETSRSHPTRESDTHLAVEAPTPLVAETAAATEAGPHGHGPQDACPLCLAQGAPLPRVHGGLDLSA